MELLPDEPLGLALVRRDEERLRLDAEAHRLALAVERGEHVAAREVVDRLRVEVVRDVARQRAGEDDELRALREVVELLEQQLELLPAHRRAPLVDLRVRAAGRVDDRRRGTRLALDAHEVVEDRLGGEALDDPQAGLAADEARRDDGHAERLQRTRDVDPLPAGGGDAGARAVPLSALEVGHGQRPVDGRVECDGDDHPKRWIT